MSRLTKKNQGNGSWTQFGDKYIPSHNIKHKQCVNRLGCIEDLMEQLYNVPLEFILKHEYNKQVYWNNAYHDVRNIVPYEEHTEPYVEIFVRENNKVVVKTLWFKDYKKTWWLKGDKVE